MTPEEKSLLERTLKMAEENNAILHGMRRMARFGTIMRVLYWFIIIGLSVGAFYFLQPYFDGLTDIFNGAQDVLEDVTGAPIESRSTNRPLISPLNLSPR